MLIKENFNYINDVERELIKNGYGELSVYSINFDRYYTEEEKENNRKIANIMSNVEWSKHCEEVQEKFGIMFDKIVEKFINSKYDIHQLTDNTSSIEHYRSNWDLYYYCNRGWNNSKYMDFFRLNFNDTKSVEKNLSLLNELMDFVEKLDYKNISCTIQYTFIPNKEKINNKYIELCEKLQNKFIKHIGMIGKIKVINENNGIKEYGFFKKGSKKKYYSISRESLILLEG